MSALQEVLRVLGAASEPLTARQIFERMPEDYRIEQVWTAVADCKGSGRAEVIDGTKPAQYVLTKGTEVPRAVMPPIAKKASAAPKPATAPSPAPTPADAPTAATVVVYGPAGSGKSRMAEHLRKHFGCAVVVDDWSPGKPLTDGALHATSAPADALSGLPKHVRIVDVFDALRGYAEPKPERPKVLAAPPAIIAMPAHGSALPALLLSRRLSAVALLLAQWPDETVPREALQLVERMAKDAAACAA